MKQGHVVTKILLFFFLFGFLISGTIFCVQQVKKSDAQEQYEQLAEETNRKINTVLEGEDIPAQEEKETVEETIEIVTEESQELIEDAFKGIPIPDKKVDFAELQANTNEDIYAWIYIPDTKIDYPVLQHPTDNQHYLDYNLDGSKGYPGCIFSESYNKKDFTDPNTVLYGHNMKNGSMFSGLHKYRDGEYMNEHPYIYIYTPEGMKVYQIFASYEFSSSHLLLNFDLESPDSFQSYLNGILERRDMNSNILDGVELTSDNRILTLSTCIARRPDSRYLVQGVLLNE